MMVRRPTPELVKARRWEIRRRYERLAKVGKRSRGMAAIRISELTRWLHDTQGIGRELEPCQQSEMIIRIFAHHFLCLPDGPRRVTSWFDRYCPWLTLADREYLIGEATRAPLKWSADKLAWKLRINYETRTRLKLTTIGAIDCNKQQREELRRKRHAELAKMRRAAKREKTA